MILALLLLVTAPADIPAGCTKANAPLLALNRLNIRSGPGTQHSILRTVRMGYAFATTYDCGEWIKIKTDYRRNGKIIPLHGWVASRLLCQMGPILRPHHDSVRPVCEPSPFWP